MIATFKYSFFITTLMQLGCAGLYGWWAWTLRDLRHDRHYLIWWLFAAEAVRSVTVAAEEIWWLSLRLSHTSFTPFMDQTTAMSIQGGSLAVKVALALGATLVLLAACRVIKAMKND